MADENPGFTSSPSAPRAVSSTPATAADGLSGPPPIRLSCLAGGAASDELVESASRASKLSPAATRELGSVLRSCMASPAAPDLSQRLSRYCVTNEIAEADLGHVIRVCRLLIREGSSIDLTPDELAADAAALFGERAELVAQIRLEYEMARPTLRRELMTDSLLKHGNVLEDIDWRIDVVTTDRNAARVGVPIALVTFAYRNAKEAERLTLQLTAEQLSRLQSMFGALSQKVGRVGGS